MKKVIRLTESDLTRIIKRVIMEDQSSVSVVAIYNEIIDAVEGWGTNPDKILSAIKKLKNQNEFKYLLTLFKDKKTGYSYFFEMINEEYERDNVEDVESLIASLHNINVFTTANFDKNRFGMPLFMGGFRLSGGDGYSVTTTDMESCKSLWSKKLPGAIKWWRDWLSDPITKKKFLSNYSDKPYAVTLYYPKYFELFNKIKLNFYNDRTIKINGIHPDGDAIAFVTEPDGNIYVNCSAGYEEEIDQILIHEIQHMIYDIKPLNPDEKISSAFGKNNPEKKSKEQIKSEFLSAPSSKTEAYSPTIIAAAKKLNIDPKYISNIDSQKNDVVARYAHDPGYICRETEKMSNITGTRKALGIKPGQNITLDMIKPYITKDKNSVDFYWILMCWAQRGFTDINQMLQHINQLALKQNNKLQQNNTPPTNPTA
jgi:hypothetical protein